MLGGAMLNRADFHFWGRLQQLLPASSAGAAEYRFNGRPAIKDSIEAQGVPHTEVDLILAAGCSVDFDYRLQNADRIDVYPFGSSIGIKAPLNLSPPVPERVAFILDVHLGKLARRLRMLGFDCRYRNDYSDPQIIDLALTEGLIILTRDRGILKHSCVSQGYLVGSVRVDEQVREVLLRYHLYNRIQALQRCPECNGLLETVDKEKILARLQPKTARYYQRFHRCADCDQLYWQGSHYEKISAWVQQCLTETG
jgi:uncharacterized protein with PIN domain